MGSSYAGVDWASDKHDVFVADTAGEKLLAATMRAMASLGTSAMA